MRWMTQEQLDEYARNVVDGFNVTEKNHHGDNAIPRTFISATFVEDDEEEDDDLETEDDDNEEDYDEEEDDDEEEEDLDGEEE